MSAKRSYLLEGAKTVDMERIASTYNASQQMNCAVENGVERPVVASDCFARTGSKTAQAPGDDDPDPEDEGCY